MPSIVNKPVQGYVSAFTSIDAQSCSLFFSVLTAFTCAVIKLVGDVYLLDTTKELIHNTLLSPTAAGALSNGAALDKQADDDFSDEVSAAIVDWIAKRMSDYHKNFHDTQLMQVGRHLQRMYV